MSGTICRFEGCVNVGSPYNYTAEGEPRTTMLCQKHADAVEFAKRGTVEEVEVDSTGRIRIAPPPHLSDHESRSLTSWMGILDTVVQNELKRHVTEPGGDWQQDTRAFFCTRCGTAFIDVKAYSEHLDAAVNKAIDAAIHRTQQTKE